MYSLLTCQVHSESHWSQWHPWRRCQKDPIHHCWVFCILRMSLLRLSLTAMCFTGYPDIWGVQNPLRRSNNSSKTVQDCLLAKITYLVVLRIPGTTFEVAIVPNWFNQVHWYVWSAEHLVYLQYSNMISVKTFLIQSWHSWHLLWSCHLIHWIPSGTLIDEESITI